jgi:probable F420-dependent oxidoreductase
VKVRFAIAPAAGTRSAEELLAFAAAVEGAGFDGIWLSDLPVGPGIDPILGLALIAGRTSTLKLGANVVPLGRNPFLLAKALAQLDRLSGGRLLLSFVAGLGQPGEREALAWQGASRGAVLEETLARVRTWWSGGAPGDGVPADAVARPLQDPLEVWLGGRAPAALDRVGRVADGWLGALVTPAEAPPARARIEAAARRAGRTVDPEHYGLSIAYARDAGDGARFEELRARRPDADPRALLPVGVEGLRAMLGELIDAGLSKFVLRPAAPVTSWDEETAWLAGAILGLQS